MGEVLLCLVIFCVMAVLAVLAGVALRAWLWEGAFGEHIRNGGGLGYWNRYGDESPEWVWIVRPTRRGGPR